MSHITRRTGFAAIALALGLALACAPARAADGDPKQPRAEPKVGVVEQASFACLETAARALYGALKSSDLVAIYRVLGPGSGDLIFTGDEVADREMRERFLAAYDESVKLELEGGAQATLLVGKQEFPFPFPLKRVASGWQFDASAGAEEILNRRIGENELSAIRACLAYGDAQREYVTEDRDGDGVLEYAQQFSSSEGKRDGLYWPVADGAEPSPLGPLYARAQSEGYELGKPEPTAFHGYYYRILKAQGADAPGGAYDYVVGDNMIGGFGLVAYPARWGASGVMSFMCSHDGIVYQKNLGPDSAAIAAQMTRFEPGEGWERVAP